MIKMQFVTRLSLFSHCCDHVSLANPSLVCRKHHINPLVIRSQSVTDFLKGRNAIYCHIVTTMYYNVLPYIVLYLSHSTTFGSCYYYLDGPCLTATSGHHQYSLNYLKITQK